MSTTAGAGGDGRAYASLSSHLKVGGPPESPMVLMIRGARGLAGHGGTSAPPPLHSTAIQCVPNIVRVSDAADRRQCACYLHGFRAAPTGHTVKAKHATTRPPTVT